MELFPTAEVVELFTKVKGKEQLFKVLKLNVATGLGKTVIGVTVVEVQFKLLTIFNVII